MSEHKTPVYGLRRPKKELFLFEITDESNPDVTVRITLIQPTIPRLMKVAESITFYTDFYMTPDKESGECPQIVADGEVIELTEDLIELICGIVGLQERLVYNFEEIAILTVTMEEGMLQVIGRAKELATKFAALMKNPTQAAIPPLSVSTINEVEDTPNLTTE